MKKLFFILLLAATTLTTGLDSCKALQAGVSDICSITTTDVCPALQYALGLGSVVNISPTSTTGQYILTAKGIQTVACNTLGTICPVILQALQNGNQVELTPIKISTVGLASTSTSIENLNSGNQVQVRIRIH